MNPITQMGITNQMMYLSMISDNIMSDLSDFSVPWKNDIEEGLINQTFLNLGYYANSANKLISPLVWDISDGVYDGLHVSIEPLTNEQRMRIAGLLYTLFNRKWSRLWEINKIEYNPINNYDMEETETSTGSGTETGTNTGTISKDIDSETVDRRTEGGTKTTTTDNDTSQTGTVNNSGTGSVDNGVFGFNSNSAVGSDSSDSTNTNIRTDNLHGTNDTTETETRNLTDNNTETIDTTESETRNLSDNRSHSNNSRRTLERSGNIGVTTTQQMITSELELWQWNFFKSVFADIDSICCLDIY